MAGNNILVVDDDNKTVSKVVDVLESEGYAVFAASSKTSAVELCTKTRPSLIYVNAILTDASGLEITRAIRGMDFMKTVPIVMLTEMEEEFSERYKSTYGIIGFLKKPIDTNDLIQKTSALVPAEGGGMGEDAFAALGIEPKEPEMPLEPEPEPEMPAAPAPEPSIEEVPGVGADFGETSLAGEEPPAAEEAPAPQPFSVPEPSPEEDIGTMAFKSFEESEQIDTVEESFSDDALEKVMEEQEKPKFTMKKAEAPVAHEMDEFDAESLFSQKDGLPGISTGDDFETETFTVGGGKSKKSTVINIIIAVVAVTALAAVVYMWFFMDFGEEQVKTPLQQAAKQPPQSSSPAAQQPVAPQTQQKPVAPQTAEQPAVTLPAAQQPRQPAQPQKPKQPPAQTAQKQTTPRTEPAAKRGRYAVQVGYFSVKENAYSLHDSLKRKNYDVYIEKSRKRSGTGYRVLIGSYRTQAQAKKAMNDIRSRERIEAAIYRRKR